MSRSAFRVACAAGVLLLAACGSHHPAAVRPPTSAAVAPTTAATGTSAPATASAPPSSPPRPVAAPLAFMWSVRVSGLSVAVGGGWAGTDATLTAAQVHADPQISSGAKAGSGVLAWSATVLTAGGEPVPAGTAPAEADFTVGVYATDGDVPSSCRGAVVAQSRAVPPMTLTFARPGTYEIVMRTTSCAGTRTDAKSFTVG